MNALVNSPDWDGLRIFPRCGFDIFERLFNCSPYGFLAIVLLGLCAFAILIWRTRNRLTRIALALYVLASLAATVLVLGKDSPGSEDFLEFALVILAVAALVIGIWGAIRAWKDATVARSQKALAITAIFAGPFLCIIVGISLSFFFFSIEPQAVLQ